MFVKVTMSILGGQGDMVLLHHCHPGFEKDTAVCPLAFSCTVVAELSCPVFRTCGTWAEFLCPVSHVILLGFVQH